MSCEAKKVCGWGCAVGQRQHSCQRKKLCSKSILPLMPLISRATTDGILSSYSRGNSQHWQSNSSIRVDDALCVESKLDCCSKGRMSVAAMLLHDLHADGVWPTFDIT